MNTLEEFVEDWKRHLETQDLSPLSVREYTRDATLFLKWLSETGAHFTKPQHIGITTAREYREYLLGHKKASTVNRKLQSLSLFLSYLDVPQKENPFKKLNAVQTIRTAPKSLDRNEWNHVRRCAENLKAKDRGLSLAIISLLRHAGLRVGEIVNLKTSDIELKDKSGKVHVRQGKGLKERTVPLNLDAREGVGPWIESRERILKRIRERLNALQRTIPPWVDSEFIFVGQRGILTTRGVGLITEKLGRLAGLSESLGTHRFRHTFARSALDPKGYMLNRDPVPLTALRDMLGHSRVETTAIYSQFEHKDHARFLEENESQ